MSEQDDPTKAGGAGGSSDLSRDLTAATPPGSVPRPPPSSIRGTTLGHFEVLERIGAGGFGEVYKARDVRVDRMVALKVLPEEFFEGEERRQRFEREARMLASLNHSGIATLYSFEEIPGPSPSSSARHVLVMELVDGQTLHARLAKGPLPAAEAVSVGIQIADALAEAHRAGILHRDIKSGNVMLTSRGQVKILDFGLAKRLPTGPSPGEVAPALTREGTTLGTLSYMSPEQLVGKAVDVRSDLFSFGVVLYEMVTGRLPFQGSTAVAVADAILHAEPLGFGERPAPERLKAIVRKLLEKDPSKRFASVEAVRAELRALEAALLPANSAGLSRQAWAFVGAGAAVAVIVAGFAWQRVSRARWARETATPEIARLVAEEDFARAAALAREARAVLPKDPTLEKLWMQATIEVSAESVPAGAEVWCRPFRGASQSWESLGRTPLHKVRVPRAFYLWRAEKTGLRAGYRIGTTDLFAGGVELTFRLESEQGAPPEMVRVPGGTIKLPIGSVLFLSGVPLEDFWIDRNEVTNEQYRKFVDAGGYRNPELWKHSFVANGRTLPWTEAMARFSDATGRPGPATWELGSYPKGQEKHPVAGVSWYEAAAYAEFAGKSLPTLFHWHRAAQTGASQLIVPGSNFRGAGTVAVGGDGAVSGFGTTDMAGNVKEWCANESAGGKRSILGGGFGEPAYMFFDLDAQPPLDRRANYGFRCVKLSSAPPSAATARIETDVRDYSKEKPVSEEVFRAYKGLYAYDKTALNARVEETETTEDWTREKVSFDAAYGGERVIAYLFLPKNGTPPYQTVVYFPGSDAISAGKFTLDAYADFIPRSGRALLAPIYKGTFERRGELKSDLPEPTALYRDHVISWSKDVGRSIDYLETRKDIDHGNLAYMGLSWGAVVAPTIVTLENRLRVAVLHSGGLIFPKALPEVDQINFVSRVRIPVLMLNGRYDHFLPVEASQLPLFRLLGSPEKDKKHVLYETGHAPPMKEIIRETLDWLDKYLGPVKR